MAAIIVAICALVALALFDLLALRYGVDSQGPLAPLIGRHPRPADRLGSRAIA